MVSGPYSELGCMAYSRQCYSAWLVGSQAISKTQTLIAGTCLEPTSDSSCALLFWHDLSEMNDYSITFQIFIHLWCLSVEIRVQDGHGSLMKPMICYKHEVTRQ